MNRIKYEKEMTGPRPKIRPENATTAMSKNIQSTYYENKRKDAVQKIGATMKRYLTRKKEKEIGKGASDYFDDIVDDVIEKNIDDSASRIGAVMKGNSARRKVAIMKEREKAVKELIGDIIQDSSNKVDQKQNNTNKADKFISQKQKKVMFNLFDTLKKEVGVRKAQELIDQAILEKQAELSQMSTQAIPGKSNPYIEYKNYNELDNVQPYLIEHKAFIKNIKHNVHGAQSAKNLMYYVEMNGAEALRYVKNNSQYIPQQYRNIKDIDHLKRAIKETIMIDTSIGVVAKSKQVAKSEGVQTRQMASSSKPQTRSKEKKGNIILQ